MRVSIFRHGRALTPRCRRYSTTLRASAEESSAQLLTARDVPASHDSFIRILTLNSPSNRNALSVALLRQLRAAFEELYKHEQGYARRNKISHDNVTVPVQNGLSEVKVPEIASVIIASADSKVFCSGADLKERAQMSIEE